MIQDVLYGPGDVILDRYELVRLLGSGGWGRVYLANDRMLHRPVAIKQLLPRLAADPAAVSRFMREASVIASIRDPHVLTVHDIAEIDGQHYMVMEYADAGTLAQMMQLEGTISPYETLSIAIDVCKGLRAVHTKGVVHRDVKPANVMFFSRTDGLPVAKIGDFGIALQPEDERLTPSDNVVGTLIYLSPEQASSSHIITHSSDLYSLGVMLYEMMSGELQEPLFVNPIFANNSNNSDVFQHLGMFPEPVRPLLIKALQRKPEDRFQNADEMLQALQRARSRLTVSFTTQAFEQVMPMEPQPAPKPQFTPARLLAIAGITLVLLAVGAMVTLGLVFGSAQPAPAPTSALLADNPTPTHTSVATSVPDSVSPSSFTLTPDTAPSPIPSPSSSPASPTPATVAAGMATPTRVTGPASLTLLLHDSYNVPQGVYAVGDDTAADPIIYLEGSYLWGEIATRVGNTVFKINRDAPNRQDPAQHLPPYLRLNIEYSAALLAVMRDKANDPPGFDAQTGEFWAGRFRCGSAVSANGSPYWVAVRLLEDDREIAMRRYVVGVLNNPQCVDKGGNDSGGPPTSR
jgi:serine/threonine protein kinase